MNYKISIGYNKPSDKVFQAIVAVSIPALNGELDGPIAIEYRSANRSIANQNLGKFWGVYNYIDYRVSLPIKLVAASISELEAMVDAEILSIKSILHDVYTNATALPENIELKVDPSVPVSIDKPTIDSEIDPSASDYLAGLVLSDWRENLKQGDLINIWSIESEYLEYGTIDTMIRGDRGEFRIDLLQTFYTAASSPIDERILSVCVSASDILPHYCDKRSDAWRFNFAYGDLVGWRDGDTSRTGYIRDIKYNIDAGEVEIIWHGESAWNNYNCMELFQT